MDKLRVAVAGVGNNISALVQGMSFYESLAARGVSEAETPAIRRTQIGGLRVYDIEVVAAFDVHPNKVGHPLIQAILAPPNNYPRLDAPLPTSKVKVEQGVQPEPTTAGARPLTEVPPSEAERRIIESLKISRAEVLLYSLPTGRPACAEAYARCAFHAGVAFVNCTPDTVAGSHPVMAAFEAARIPLLGDDLASHLGSSVVHKSLLELLDRRGISLRSSYQINFGGNEDFKNLRDNGQAKARSKKAALAGTRTDLVDVIPSAGYIPSLQDTKVAIINIEAVGWAGTRIALDLRLQVQDSSNAAGVIIDLIRQAGEARRAGKGGFVDAAAPLLKSPPGGGP